MKKQITEEQVMEVLKEVCDPELGINIVDLGLIYEVKIEPRTSNHELIRILMTLTTVGCPLGGWFVEQVKQAVALGLKLDEDQVMVEITFDPPWSQDAMSKDAKEQMGLI
jgi:metal-sulfur cluster biosynthetic enzyme